MVAALQIGDIIRHGVDDKYLVGPAEAPDRELGGKAATEMFRMFTPGASIVMALRLFELFGALLQLPQPLVCRARNLVIGRLPVERHFLDHTTYDCGTLP